MQESDKDTNQGDLFGEDGPKDQIGFEDLEPAPDHPASDAQQADAARRAYAENDGDDEAGGGDHGDGAGPPDEPPSEPPPGPEPESGGAMGLLDHLGELRSVLIQSGLAALAAAVLCWFWSGRLLDLLVLPIQDHGVYFTAPNEAFLTRLKLAGAVGLFVVAPFILFRIYGFVLPGLYKREKKIITPLIVATTGLFYLGVAFAFMVVNPQVVRFLMSFGTDYMSPLIGVGPYFAFVVRMCLAFGIVFELPLLVLVLSVVGIVNPRMLLRAWRFAVLVIVALAALLTPPDVISQLMMAGPVLVLYIGSVLISIAVTRKRSKED